VLVLFGVIVSVLEVGIQGWHGFTCSVGFMGRRYQVIVGGLDELRNIKCLYSLVLLNICKYLLNYYNCLSVN